MHWVQCRVIQYSTVQNLSQTLRYDLVCGSQVLTWCITIIEESTALSSTFPMQYTTVQYITVLHYSAQYCTIFYYTVLYYILLYCIVLYCTVLHLTVLFCIALKSILLSIQYLVLSISVPYRGVLNSTCTVNTVHQCTVQYITVHYSTV